jgi:LuxR family maltose regulon positive regulatory protein
MQHEAQRRFGEDFLRSLHDKASHWYEEHGLLAEAVEAALSARDFPRAAALIERVIDPYGASNELLALLRWAGQLPEKVLQAHPELCLAYAVALLFSRDRSDPATMTLIQTPLVMAERFWEAEGNRPKLGEALAFRSQVALWQEDLPQALAAAKQALELLPEQEVFWRGSSILTMGRGEMLSGKLDTARRRTLEAQTLFEAAGNAYGARAATYTLGEISSRQGELHAAAQFYRQELAEAAEDPFDMASALISLAALSYEWNELEEAERQISQAFDLGKHHVDEIGKYHEEQLIQIPASLVLARVLHARGETAQAQQLLQGLVVLAQERKWLYFHREVLAAQARLLHVPVVSSYHTNLAAYCEHFGFGFLTETMWAYNRFLHSEPFQNKHSEATS